MKFYLKTIAYLSCISIFIFPSNKAFSADKIIIQNHIHIESTAEPELNINPKQMKLMKAVAERQWAEQNEKATIHKDYYNIGLMQFKDKKYDEAINAFANALSFSSKKAKDKNSIQY